MELSVFVLSVYDDPFAVFTTMEAAKALAEKDAGKALTWLPHSSPESVYSLDSIPHPFIFKCKVDAP